MQIFTKMRLLFKIVILGIVVIFSQNINAQISKIDYSLHQKLSEKKEQQIRNYKNSELNPSKNQEDYDIKYYSLNFVFDTSTEITTAVVEVKGEVITSSLQQLELNFWTGMDITSIYLSSEPATQLSYTHANDILDINLGSAYSNGELFDVVIEYNGSPQNSYYGSFGFNTYNGHPLIWTRSEPYGSRGWWPCKDFPSDKADSVDIRVTVPENLIVASNGTLMDTTTVDGMKTWWWHEKYPIVTYLVSLNIYPYIFYQDDYLYNNNTDTMKIDFYVFPDNYDTYYTTNLLVKDMIGCFDTLFGPYPFLDEKYGHADDFGGGAMEHQTCSSFSFWGETVYAHELAHQWWGDYITCNSFHHIWLNEGFATYSEALWYERAYPPYTASEYQMSVSHYMGGGTIYVEDPENETIFHGGLSYDKGSWVLHMLRHVVGNDNFFQILQSYYASIHQHGTATTEEFQAVCEQVAGINLDKFFHQWIYEEYYPQYTYGYNISPEGNGYNINVTINQTQENTILFWMPIDLKVTTISSDTTFVVWDSLQSQTFQLYVEEAPVNVELDPDNWILKTSEQQLIAPYAMNANINNIYQVPGTDSVIVTSEVYNPDDHIISVQAIFNSFDGSIIDTITLYDDGLHNDGTAGDDIFGGKWGIPDGERNYHISILTNSITSGYYNILYNASQFTTIGPVTLYEYNITTTDTIPNHGDILRFEFTLKNESASETVNNITSRIFYLDTCSFPIALVTPEYGNIEPGVTSIGNQQQMIRFDSDCPDSIYTNLKIEIYSDDILYWIDTITIFLTDPTNGIEGHPNNLTSFKLEQNYPNPFNPSTTIRYNLAKASQVELAVFNAMGQKITKLVSEHQTAGYHQVVWDGKNKNGSFVSSGIYIYQIKTGVNLSAKKMIYMK